MKLLDALPASLLPGSLDYMVNLFEADARVDNKTPATLYLTAITTTYGHPLVITQDFAFRQRDIPVAPQGTVTLQYDSADFPLAGIAVCRSDTDCRLLEVETSNSYEITSFESLPGLEAAWLAAMQAQPLYSYHLITMAVLSLLPIFLFITWIYLRKQGKSTAG